MIKFRIFIFFIFCILHQWEILDAASAKRDISTESKESKGSSKESKGSSNVCQTAECKNAASEILKSIDTTVDKCDDFYKFACGKFFKTAVVPEDETYVDRYSSLTLKNKEQLKKSLEEPTQHNEPKYITLSKNYYKACMDEAGIEKNGLQTILGQFKKMGGWPLLEGDSWKEKNFNWIKATYDLHDFGYNMFYFFITNCMNDDDNSSRNILSIDQPFLSLEEDVLVKGPNDKTVKLFYDYMVETAVVFKINRSTAEKECKAVLDFMIKLGSITKSLGDDMAAEVPSTKMTVKKLTAKYPIVPWKEYFNKFLKPNAVIGDDEVITVYHPDFFEKFNALMKQPPPKRVLANYMFLMAVQEAIPYSTKELIKPFSKYSSARYGPRAADAGPRDIMCLEYTTTTLGVSTGALYVQKYFNQKSKKNVEELAVALEEQLKKSLKELDWMDEKTKMSALDKLKSMKNSIGSLDHFQDDKFVQEYYKNLEIPPNNFLQAYLNTNLFTTNKFFSHLRTSPKKSDVNMLMNPNTFDTNADYDGNSNSIVLPAGVLQDIFYNENRPQYLNFAGLGSFNIANHITRAIDDNGRRFDKNGDSKDWWTPETKKRYLQKSACIKQQYGSYTYKDGGFKVTGNRTLLKNVADNGGVKMAYLAYQDWVKQHGPEPTLPGLEYSPAQLFWIQAAVTQCAKYTPDFLKEANPDNSLPTMGEFSTPSEFRVTGLFANRPEFAKDFNCKPGSKMNPVKRCSEW